MVAAACCGFYTIRVSIFAKNKKEDIHKKLFNIIIHTWWLIHSVETYILISSVFKYLMTNNAKLIRIMTPEKWSLVSCAWWPAAGVSIHDISVNHRHAAPDYYYWQNGHPFSTLPLLYRRALSSCRLVNHHAGRKRNRFKRPYTQYRCNMISWCNTSLTVMSKDYVQVRPAKSKMP